LTKEAEFVKLLKILEIFSDILGKIWSASISTCSCPHSSGSTMLASYPIL